MLQMGDAGVRSEMGTRGRVVCFIPTQLKPYVQLASICHHKIE